MKTIAQTRDRSTITFFLIFSANKQNSFRISTSSLTTYTILLLLLQINVATKRYNLLLQLNITTQSYNYIDVTTKCYNWIS